MQTAYGTFGKLSLSLSGSPCDTWLEAFNRARVVFYKNRRDAGGSRIDLKMNHQKIVLEGSPGLSEDAANALMREVAAVIAYANAACRSAEGAGDEQADSAPVVDIPQVQDREAAAASSQHGLVDR
jgi:hypothetical protein